MTSWPADLPQYFDAQGYRETLGDARAEHPTDTGPGKTYKRFTKAWRTIAGSLRCTPEQAAALETFYRETLKGGTLDFFWTAPVTRLGARLRFRAPPVLVMQSSEEYLAQVSLWQIKVLPELRFDSTLVTFDSTEHTFDAGEAW